MQNLSLSRLLIFSYKSGLYLNLHLHMFRLVALRVCTLLSGEIVSEPFPIRDLAADCLIFIIFKHSYFKPISSFYIVVYKALEGFPAVHHLIIYIISNINDCNLTVNLLLLFCIHYKILRILYSTLRGRHL